MKIDILEETKNVSDIGKSLFNKEEQLEVTNLQEQMKNYLESDKKIVNKETKSKIAYLTFDDGPYYLTDEYLKVLKKYFITFPKRTIPKKAPSPIGNKKAKFFLKSLNKFKTEFTSFS